MQKINFKKAAMFGLDARIALAIFGALSVISGAALYSAIQEAEATALIVELQEAGKSFEQYILDNGYPPRSGTDNTGEYFYMYDARELIENTRSLNTWKGPYLPYETISTHDHIIKPPKYARLYLRINRNDDDWGGSLVGTHWCETGKSCSLFIQFTQVPFNSGLLQRIDEKIDGSDGPDAGSFRWGTTVDPTHVNLKIMPLSNPND